jgi:hypothetical protein
MISLQGIVGKLYHLILRAYPSQYLDTFGDEIQNTFIEGMQEANHKNKLTSFILRELFDMPKVLVYSYWYGWSQKLAGGIDLLHQVTSSSDLPPAPPDGRTSWRQFLLEISMFLIAGLLMILATYFPLPGLVSGWGRNAEFLGNIILPLTVPFLILGLIRGLPRWTYPLGGLLFSYFGLIAGQTNLWLFLTIMLLASAILIVVAILTAPNPSRLPIPLRRIGQSLSLDWTRLSFGVFGALPLIILTAFDDAHTNSQTPYFGFSVLTMIVSVLIYCKSSNTNIQISILLAGLTFSISGAWWDAISFSRDLTNWTTVTGFGIESIIWIAVLWIQWAIIMLFPVVFPLLGKVVHMKRAV